MTLSEYLRPRGSTRDLALRLGVAPQLVTQWSTGSRQVPAERCPVIERLTGGQVTCEELRPDVEWSVLRDGVQPALQVVAQA
jgi:DNA-binding transcriptional regulator YdaS (Cro superfamily)